MCVIFNFSDDSGLCNCGLHLQFSPTFQAQITDLTELLFKVILNVGSLFVRSFQYMLVLYLMKCMS